MYIIGLIDGVDDQSAPSPRRPRRDHGPAARSRHWLRMGQGRRPSRRSRPIRSRKPMRSPTRSARGDMDALKDELGDLQLQVVYHARMAEEIGAFTLDDVMASICDKMIRRHPHIFGDAAASPGWEALKAAERERSSRRKRARRRRPRPPRLEARRERSSAAPPGSASTGPTSAGPRQRSTRSWARSSAPKARRNAPASSATCCSRWSIMPATSA